jgi:hypothetical protein
MSEYEGAVKPSSIEKDLFDVDLTASRITEIPTNLKMRLDYDLRTDGQPVYQGFAPTGFAEGIDGWLIYKFTFIGDLVSQRDIAYGNWTARTGYTYA